LSAVGFLFFRPAPKPDQTSHAPSAPEVEPVQQSVKEEVTAETSSLLKTPEIEKLTPDGKKKLLGLLEMGSKFNVPITFFGKIVDQDNRPVEGVGVKIKVTSFDPNIILDLKRSDENKYTPISLLTDVQGLFSVGDLQGRSMLIESVFKDGYQSPPSIPMRVYYSPEFDSTRIHHPDPKTPVIIRLWKKGTSQSLVSGSKFYGIVPDGRIYTIDLLQGQKIEGAGAGDVKVQIKRPATITPQTKYDWSFAVEGVRGGVVESADELLYQAPEGGYQPRYEFALSASSPEWTPTTKKRLYVRSRNGQVYSSLSVEVISNYQDKAVFNVQYFVNPSGSRSLQPSNP
jgi:hypothetical protein